jgi:hypothetical protein
MRRTALAALTLAIAAATPASWADQASQAACISRSTALLDALDKGDYNGATKNFDKQMREVATPDQLQQRWTSLPGKVGASKGRGAPNATEQDEHVIVITPLQFEKMNLDAFVACDNTGAIAGFNLAPHGQNMAQPQGQEPPQQRQ